MGNNSLTSVFSAKRSLFRVFACFTATALLYTAALAIFVKSDKVVSETYDLFFANICTLFAFSLAYGFLRDIFLLKLSSPVKRVIHIVALYAVYLAVLFIMADVGDDPRQIILFVIIATLLYVVGYAAEFAIRLIIKKAVSHAE